MTIGDGRRWDRRTAALAVCGGCLLMAGAAYGAGVTSTARVTIEQAAIVTGEAALVIGGPQEIARSAAYTDSLLNDPSVVVDGAPNQAYSLSLPKNVTFSVDHGGQAVGTLLHNGGLTPTVGEYGNGGVAIWGKAELTDAKTADGNHRATTGHPEPFLPALPGPRYVSVVVDYN